MNESRFRNGQISWKLSQFTSVIDESGELGVLEIAKDFAFPVKRMFFLRNIKAGEARGFHAHEALQQVILCLSGSFSILLDDGVNRSEIDMTANNTLLTLDGKVWREMHHFSEDCIMVVLCDVEYALDTVIRDFDEFTKNLEVVNGKL